MLRTIKRIFAGRAARQSAARRHQEAVDEFRLWRLDLAKGRKTRDAEIIAAAVEHAAAAREARYRRTMRGRRVKP